MVSRDYDVLNAPRRQAKKLLEILKDRHITLIAIAENSVNQDLKVSRADFTSGPNQDFQSAFNLQDEIHGNLVGAGHGERMKVKTNLQTWSTTNLAVYLLLARDHLGYVTAVTKTKEADKGDEKEFDEFTHSGINAHLQGLRAIKEQFPQSFKRVWTDVFPTVEELNPDVVAGRSVNKKSRRVAGTETAAQSAEETAQSDDETGQNDSAEGEGDKDAEVKEEPKASGDDNEWV